MTGRIMMRLEVHTGQFKYGKRQDSIRVFKLRTGVYKMDWQVSELRTMEHFQGNTCRSGSCGASFGGLGCFVGQEGT